MPSRSEVIERERRWAIPAAIATMVAIVLTVASIIVIGNTVSADTDPELLKEIDGERGAFMLAYVLRGLGAALLAIPIIYLFRAALARSETMRGQFLGVAIAGPIFLGVSAIASGFSLLDAASEFADFNGPLDGDAAEERADDLIGESSWAPVATGFGFGGAIGYSVAMAYTAFHAMRAGLLTRFWGTFGIALGVVSILLFQFTLLWFIYIGLLFAGWVPGGRPAAWGAGEAVPWPSPGENLAASLEEERADDIEGSGSEQDADDSAPANPPRERGERRKRKRRG